MIPDKDTQRMLDAAIAAAKAAGSSLMESLNTIRASRKEDGSLVTNLDIMSEQIILSQLQQKFPRYGYLSEESGASGPTEARWIIDPIDATDLLVHGIGKWSIMIGFEYFGEIVLGVIYNPPNDRLYSAVKGKGAFFNLAKQLRVSDTKDLKESLLLHSGLKTLNATDYRGSFDRLLAEIGSERGIGDYPGWVYVADGRADAGFHYWLDPEDLAAPKIIIEETGGTMTDFNGNDSIYSGHALVSNGWLHDDLLRIING